MRPTKLIILFMLCCVQVIAQSKPENIYTFDEKGEIVVNEKFIDHQVEFSDQSVKPYKLVGITTFEAHAEKYELHTLNYNGWENEAGDFRVIRLHHNGKQILEFTNDDAWIGDPLFKEGQTWLCDSTRSIYSGGRAFCRILDMIGEHTTYKGHCLVFPLENDATALLLEGFCYGNDNPLLTIIIIKDGRAKVVYNKPWFVTGIYTCEREFKLYLKDDCCTPQNIGLISTKSDGSMVFESEPYTEDTTIYLQPDILPVFPGGLDSLKYYLRKNIKYPTPCRQQGIQGRVIVQFVVNIDGTIADAKVVKPANVFLDREALRVVNAMPKWKPGIKNSKKVRVQFTLPITFKTDFSKHEKAIKMLTAFYEEYVLRGSTKHFQLDAAKYCTPRFLSKLGEDYEEQLKEDYIISQKEIGLEWWSFYNFINGYQDGPNEIDEVMKVVPERNNTYRIYFIECGEENHRLIDLVERNDSLFIDDAYREKLERIDNEYKVVRY